MTRVRDWEQRFVAAINAERAKAFAYGVADCATLMGASVRACLPDHPVLALLDRYKTATGAARLLKAEGGLAAVLDAHFGPVAASLAQTGDIGLLIAPDGTAAGLVIEGARAIGRSPETGFYFIPVASVSRAYRVG